MHTLNKLLSIPFLSYSLYILVESYPYSRRIISVHTLLKQKHSGPSQYTGFCNELYFGLSLEGLHAVILHIL